MHPVEFTNRDATNRCRLRVDASNGDGDPIRVTPRAIKGGNAANFAEEVKRYPGTKSIFAQFRLTAKYLKIRLWHYDVNIPLE